MLQLHDRGTPIELSGSEVAQRIVAGFGSVSTLEILVSDYDQVSTTFAGSYVVYCRIYYILVKYTVMSSSNQPWKMAIQ
jgi:hypothetical protein